MKNLIQRTILFSILGILAGTAPSTPLFAVVDPQAAGQFSDDDLKFLEELSKEIQRHVDTLPTRAQLRAQGIPKIKS